MEAQACGLPCLVSPEGGPKETVVDKETGLVLPATDPAAWCEAITPCSAIQARLQSFAAAARERGSRFGIARSFEAFWQQHVALGDPPVVEDSRTVAPAPAGLGA